MPRRALLQDCPTHDAHVPACKSCQAIAKRKYMQARREREAAGPAEPEKKPKRAYTRKPKEKPLAGPIPTPVPPAAKTAETCVVPGTLVYTGKGPVPIEAVGAAPVLVVVPSKVTQAAVLPLAVVEPPPPPPESAPVPAPPVASPPLPPKAAKHSPLSLPGYELLLDVWWHENRKSVRATPVVLLKGIDLSKPLSAAKEPLHSQPLPEGALPCLVSSPPHMADDLCDY